MTKTYYVSHTQVEKRFVLCIKPVNAFYGLPGNGEPSHIIPTGTLLYMEDVMPYTYCTPEGFRFFGDVIAKGGKMFRIQAKYGTRKKFEQHFLLL